MICKSTIAVLALLLAVPPAVAETKGPLVFAAASMKTALDAIVLKYSADGKAAPVVSYGSSGTLAKQIQGGAPADLFISADQKWMDVLSRDGAIDPATMKIEKGFDLAGAIGDGKLAVCTVTSCPAGIYGKEALEKLGVWAAVEPKLAQAENVRAALLLVARGEAKFGIVYATDAKAEPKVKVVGTFPEDTHAPIVYPVALVKGTKNPDAAAFEAFLRSPQATTILTGQGFTVLGKK